MGRWVGRARRVGTRPPEYACAVANAPSPDTQLSALGGESRQLEQWLTTFHLASVIIDPFTNESSWILPPAVRILHELTGSSARANFVVTGTEAEARRFLGPIAKEFLVFTDPNRDLVRGIGLSTLPAFAFIRIDGTVPAVAEGWDPQQWHAVGEAIAETTSWKAPTIPAPGDPTPFHGTPALG